MNFLSFLPPSVIVFLGGAFAAYGILTIILFVLYYFAMHDNNYKDLLLTPIWFSKKLDNSWGFCAFFYVLLLVGFMCFISAGTIEHGVVFSVLHTVFCRALALLWGYASLKLFMVLSEFLSNKAGVPESRALLISLLVVILFAFGRDLIDFV